MIFKKIICVLLFFCCINIFFSTFCHSEQKVNEYKKFLEQVSPVIDDEEKAYFLKLDDERKETFIQQFWDKLDPIPATPENEFKNDYLARLDYVNTWYGRNSQRSKTYLVLGKPDFIQSYTSAPGIFPLEVWYYDHLAIDGLPASLRLIFFKRHGVGDYRLYSPLLDGINEIMINRSLDPAQSETKQLLWTALGYDLRTALESISPGFNKNTSEIYLARLSMSLNTLKKKFGAEKRPTVETTIYYKSYPAQVITFIHLDQSMNYIIEGGVFIPRSFLSYEKYQDNYYAKIEISLDIMNEDTIPVDAINDVVNLQFTESQWNEISVSPLFYSFSSILLPGSYRLVFLIRNSLKNEAFKIEKDVVVLELENQDIAATDLLLGYKAIQEERYKGTECMGGPMRPPSKKQIVGADQCVRPQKRKGSELESGNNNENIIKPFEFSKMKYFPVTDNRFSLNQNVLVYNEIYFNNEQGIPEEPVSIIYVLKSSRTERMFYEVIKVNDLLLDNRILPLLGTLSLKEVPAGTYALEAQINMGDDILWKSGKSELLVTSEPVNFKRILAERTQTLTPFVLHYNLARQYFMKENIAKAREHIIIALDFDSDSSDALLLSSEISRKEEGNSP
ncbi:MAG: hypothetical protein A2Y62_04555 [Candidatus Fischerbacteria bacterium RBG_13_37_8]|uniref:GWxTD domain-containing protein n=1 Tax=Candidatus Fischerbacteria bacterium RBG_13_37_8 TaxID=1817863 RepID=A0A1F5VXP7_9BACT|nr:MAG: hypothetical protein A2Y62_04555 [Candidatus Fischerbacteria bacterium RBG_13_37_8]